MLKQCIKESIVRQRLEEAIFKCEFIGKMMKGTDKCSKRKISNVFITPHYASSAIDWFLHCPLRISDICLCVPF